MMRTFGWAAVVAHFCVATGSVVQVATLERLKTNDPYFGGQIAFDGSVLAVGSLQEEHESHGAGMVYIFSLQPNGAWEMEAELRSLKESFGSSISLYNNRLAVGAPEENTVEVYERDLSQGAPKWKIIKDIKEPGRSLFGKTVGLGANYLAVGETKGGMINQETMKVSGSVNVFDVNEWKELFRLAPSNGEAFGKSLALAGNKLAVANKGGSVFLTDLRTNTLPEAPLIAREQSFGSLLQVTEDGVVVGASPYNNSIVVAGQDGTQQVFSLNGVAPESLDVYDGKFAATGYSMKGVLFATLKDVNVAEREPLSGFETGFGIGVALGPDNLFVVSSPTAIRIFKVTGSTATLGDEYLAPAKPTDDDTLSNAAIGLPIGAGAVLFVAAVVGVFVYKKRRSISHDGSVAVSIPHDEGSVQSLNPRFTRE